MLNVYLSAIKLFISLGKAPDIICDLWPERERERTRRKDTRFDSRMLSIAIVNRTKPKDDANFITECRLAQIRRRA